MPHIVETKDEKLDYKKFWTFPPEVKDITKAAGNRFWEITQGLADEYPCPPCKPGAQALTHGGHDVVNLLLGRKVRTPQHFEMLHDMVEEAWDRYTQRKGEVSATHRGRHPEVVVTG